MPGPFDDLISSQYGGLFDPPALATTLPTLAEPEKQSILRSLASAGAGGLHALNYLLDLPGRPVRSALAGRFGDILPSIVDSSRAPSGEDLAKQWGLLQGEGTKGQFEMRDLVGPAIEIATNPTTFLNPLGPLVGGELTAAGRAAKLVGRGIPGDAIGVASQAGKLEPTLAGRIATGQGSLFKLGLPFTQGGLNLGTGQTALNIADRVGDVYGKIGSSLPGRVGASLFDKAVEGTTDSFLQPILRRGSALGEGPAAEAEFGVRQLARGLAPDAALTEVPLYQSQYGALGADLFKTPQDVMRGINEGVLDAIPGTSTGDIGTAFSQIADTKRAAEKLKGLKGGEIEGYAPRALNEAYKEDFARRGFELGDKPATPFQKSQLARSVPDEYVAGRTAGLQAMSLDPSIAGAIRSGQATAEQVQETILKNFMGVSDPEYTLYQSLKQINPQFIQPQHQTILDRLAPKFTDAEKLSELMGNLSPETVAKGIPLYGGDYFGDWTKRLTSGARAEGKAQALIEGLSKVAKPAGAVGPDSMPLGDVLRRAGLGDGASALVNPALHVPAEVADSVSRFVTAFQRPESVAPLVQAYDTFLSMFRVGVSTIFPASRARDAIQNVWQNFIKGNRDTRFAALDPRSYVRPYADAISTFRQGSVVADAVEIPAIKALGITDPVAATKYIADQAAALGLIRPGEVSQAVTARSGIPMASHGFATAGESKPFLKGITEGATALPWDLHGIGGRTETQFLPAKVGGRAIEAIDDIGRGAAFYAQLRQGASFEQAARAATEAMYDYGNLTKAEKAVMRRVVPFYSFMRQNIPAQLEELIKNPGGKLATAVKLTEEMRNKQDFVPEQLGEGLSLPIGQKDSSGRQTYLTHFGLPYEEALGPVGGGVKGTLQNLFSEMTPAIKGPIELATGQSLFTGRPLQSGVTGTILQNSPLSRLYNTGQALGRGDFMRLASPLRTQDINVDQAQQAAAREAIQEALFGNPDVKKFETLSVNKAALPRLTERDLKLMALYHSLNQRQTQRVSP